MRTTLSMGLKMMLFCCIYTVMYGQSAVGSKAQSTVAELELNSENKGVLLPKMPVPENQDTDSPVKNPALGLWLFNTGPSNIKQNLGWGSTYWGNGPKYQTMSTINGIYDIVEDSNIPLLIFSIQAGQKNNIPCGTGSCGGQRVKLIPTAQEILIDNFYGWNQTTSSYTVKDDAVFVVEYVSEISNSGGGTSVEDIFLNGSSSGFAFGRYLSSMSRAYTTLSVVMDVKAGDRLEFYYSYTANNYSLVNATINVYKY